ncbi:cell division protein DrpB [Intestinirhabdus alba]|uniref:Cell division protein DrpB n=1 Tax=Intestinirhabdus alba TaxID=2899544 RepID=A0A6L6IQ36_9ENTR|nr:cell division protein DrpB [Intestinirhabdus alba]MTH48047.1 hypothetical protein [Intestinirhabdus alba]
MEEKASRSMGGKLALWVFYAFCGYFLWAMARYVLAISRGETEGVQVSGLAVEFGANVGIWPDALLDFLVSGLVGLILGGIAWYTRPRGERV